LGANCRAAPSSNTFDAGIVGDAYEVGAALDLSRFGGRRTADGSEPGAPPGPRVRAILSLALLTIDLTRLRAAIRSRWGGALGAAVCVGLPLGVGVAVGHSDWGAFASLGGFAGFYGRTAAYRARLRLVLVVGVVLTTVVPLAGLAGSHTWSAVVVLGGVAAASSFVCRALAVPPPREYLIILAALASSGVPRDLASTVGALAQVGAGALLALAVTAVWALPGRGQAEQAPLRAAWAALRVLIAATASPEVVRCRREAVAAVRAARIAVVARTEHVERSLAAAEVLLPAAVSASLDAATPLAPRWDQAIADLSRGDNPRVERLAPNAAAEATLAAGIRAAWSVLTGTSTIAEPSPRGARATLTRLRLASSRESVVLPIAGRVAIAVGLGVATGRALGLQHSYWVALTAAAALQADSFTGLARRSLNRVFGTCVGVVAAAGFFALHPSLAVVTGVATVAQWLAEIAIADYYALGVTFVSIVALSIYQLATGATSTGSALDARLLDTAIGVGLVVILRLGLWPRATAARAPQRAAAVLQAIAATFEARWQRGSDAVPERRRLEEQLLPYVAITQELRGEPGPLGARMEQVSEAIEQLAMLALGLPHDRARPPARETAALTARLRQLADALARGEPADVDQVPVRIRGYPRTTAAVALLHAAMLSCELRPTP
jgi:uncharacterized membrane protein YccC